MCLDELETSQLQSPERLVYLAKTNIALLSCEPNNFDMFLVQGAKMAKWQNSFEL